MAAPNDTQGHSDINKLGAPRYASFGGSREMGNILGSNADQFGFRDPVQSSSSGTTTPGITLANSSSTSSSSPPPPPPPPPSSSLSSSSVTSSSSSSNASIHFSKSLDGGGVHTDGDISDLSWGVPASSHHQQQFQHNYEMHLSGQQQMQQPHHPPTLPSQSGLGPASGSGLPSSDSLLNAAAVAAATTGMPVNGLGVPDVIGHGINGSLPPDISSMGSGPPSSNYVSHFPGPPIQTNKSCQQGPDGCNLFIFHIPNDLTNMDLYNLFIPFGTVISARIMVENETGRSRGFGFVSFDHRHSADIAIQSMNGYQIGRKRLKVQHKKETRGGGGGSSSMVGLDSLVGLGSGRSPVGPGGSRMMGSSSALGVVGSGQGGKGTPNLDHLSLIGGGMGLDDPTLGGMGGHHHHHHHHHNQQQQQHQNQQQQMHQNLMLGGYSSPSSSSNWMPPPQQRSQRLQAGVHMVGGVGRSNSIGGRGVGDVRRQQQQPHIVEYNATLNQGQQIQMQQIQHPQIQQQVQQQSQTQSIDDGLLNAISSLSFDGSGARHTGGSGLTNDQSNQQQPPPPPQQQQQQQQQKYSPEHSPPASPSPLSVVGLSPSSSASTNCYTGAEQLSLMAATAAGIAASNGVGTHQLSVGPSPSQPSSEPVSSGQSIDAQAAASTAGQLALLQQQLKQQQELIEDQKVLLQRLLGKPQPQENQNIAEKDDN